MSEYRQLHRSFWESSSVEKMDPVEKLLYCYLITAPASNMEGLYKQSLRRIAFETGIDADMVTQLCERLESKRLAGFKDGWVCVTQATEHMSTSPKMITHSMTIYRSVPKNIWEWAIALGYALPRGLKGADTISHYTIQDKTILGNAPVEPKSTKPKPRHATLDVPMNAKRYETLCGEYGKRVVDDYMERVKDWAMSKDKRFADYAAAAANWMRRDNVPTRIGYGVSAPAVAPAACDCGGKVKSTHDEALCMDCGKEWRLIADKWIDGALDSR